MILMFFNFKQWLLPRSFPIRNANHNTLSREVAQCVLTGCWQMSTAWTHKACYTRCLFYNFRQERISVFSLGSLPECIQSLIMRIRFMSLESSVVHFKNNTSVLICFSPSWINRSFLVVFLFLFANSRKATKEVNL